MSGKVVANPQVIIKNRYQVVPRSIIFLVTEGKVLLQKGSPDKKVFPGFYNGVGGHIERGEDVLTGAKRELMEETGLSCSDLRFTGTVAIDVTEAEGILLFVFLGTQISGQLTGSSEGSLYWVDITKFNMLPLVEDVPELVANSLLSINSGKLFFGKYQYNETGNRTTTWQWC